MKQDKRKYSLVWKECGRNSAVGKRFYVPEYEGFLPFFIYGRDCENLKNGKKVELKEEHLLTGILYGLHEFEHHPKPWHKPQDKQTYLYLLDVLGNGFKFKSPEHTILSVASIVRDKNGNLPSSIILKVGSNLIPNSSKIKSDLIMDLWELAAQAAENDGTSQLFNEILSLISDVDPDDILPGAREVVYYCGLAALVFLKKNESISDYLEKFIYPNVSNQTLKTKIKYMLENPEKVTLSDLKLELN